MLLSLLPVGAFATEAEFQIAELGEVKPVTKAADISSISVPAYSGGTASTWMTYDGGDCVSYQDGENRSKMQIIKGTTATQYNTYCTKLTSNGYAKVWSRTLAAQSGSNRYAKFLSADGSYSVYTYFVPKTSQTRIIVDTHPDTVEGFVYDGQGDSATEVYMYGLSYPDNGYAYTSTELGIQRRFPNGSMFVIKMPDNSLFVIDGGNKLQMSERAMADLYDFCRKITGLPEGQKIIVSGWHISHIHNDHSVGFSRFLSKYSQHFELKNIIYNTDLVDDSTNQQALNQVAQLFPNARYYKPHTGERFTIAGVTFDVLYTIDDWYKANSSNKLLVRDSACLNYSNDNNASMALRMSFEGKTALWLGDLEKADADLMAMYPAADLKSDILQLPHHLLDDHTTLVQTIEPTVSFANQSKQGAYTRGKVFNYIIKIDSLTDIYYSGNETVGYRADKGVLYREEHTEFEYGNWGVGTYDIRHDTPFISEEIKAEEQFYRYSRAKELKSGVNAYAIVDHTTDWMLAYDTAGGTASRAMPAHYINDTYYLAASQRGLVNWQIQYSDHTTKEKAIVPNYGNYSVTVNRGTGDYWGTSTKNTGLYFGYNDTFQSTGMYSSWTAFHNQLESSSKGIWMDQMNGGSFLMYRYNSGTYYPLYRDGDVLEDNGWGVAKLTYSQARNKCHYLKLRLYLYEETPSDMYLTWLGHQDYYVYPGIAQNEVISYITSDLRVEYRLPSFGVNGEITYDASLTKEPGTYRVEFTKSYSANTVGDYPAVIKYINPNGTIQELGRVTVHVEKRDPMEDGGAELFFDFNDTPDSRLRYRLEPQYSYFNFDSEMRWTTSLYDNDNKKYTAMTHEVNTDQGTMELKVQDTTATRKTLLLDLFAGSQFPLQYDPQYAEVLQIRLKISDMQSYSTYNPFLRLWYYGTDQARHFDVAHYFGKNYSSDGEYITLTLDLFTQAEVDENASVSGAPTSMFKDMDQITGIRLGFYYLMVEEGAMEGSISIDHIYIGPKANAPVQESSLFFGFGNSADDQLRYTSETYKGLNFDRAEQPNWATRENSETSTAYGNFTVDNATGTAIIPVTRELAYNNTSGIFGPWFVNTPLYGTLPNARDPQKAPLSYEPGNAEYVQLRFKVEDCEQAPGKNTDIVVIYDRTADGDTRRGGEFVAYYTYKEDQWITLTFPVTKEFSTADFVTSFGVRFRAIRAKEGLEGKVILDYLFVGPKEELPTEIATLRFTDENGTLLSTVYAPVGGAVDYRGATPTKEADEGGAWIFAGWADEEGKLVDMSCAEKDGTLHPTFCRDLTETEDLKLRHSLNLSSDISVNFVVPMSALAGFDLDSVYVECRYYDYVDNEQGQEIIRRISPVEKGGYYYYFTLEGLTAIHMTNELRSVLYGTKDGRNYCSPVDVYSIADYAYSQLNNTSAGIKLRTLCAELLRYGASAQSYKGYRTDKLADGDMTEQHMTLLTDLETVSFGNINTTGNTPVKPSVFWIGKTLDLNTKVTVLYVVNVADYTGEFSDLSLRVEYTNYEGKTVTVSLTELEPYQGSESFYTFRMDSLLAAELRTVLRAQVYEGETAVSTLMTYSPDTYGNNKTGLLGTLCKALFAYSDAAKAYFAS